MNEVNDVCAIEALVNLVPRDPLDVLCSSDTSKQRELPFPSELQPKGGFELAWDLAH